MLSLIIIKLIFEPLLIFPSFFSKKCSISYVRNDSPLLRNMCLMSHLLGKNGFSNFLDKAVKSFLSSLNRLKQIPILAFKPFRKCCWGKGFCVLYDLSSMFVNLTFKIKRPLAQLYVG